jgi:hypothetical protein
MGTLGNIASTIGLFGLLILFFYLIHWIEEGEFL